MTNLKDEKPLPLDQFFAQERNVQKVEQQLTETGHVDSASTNIIANFPEQTIPHLSGQIAAHLRDCPSCRYELNDWLEEFYLDTAEARTAVRNLIEARLTCSQPLPASVGTELADASGETAKEEMKEAALEEAMDDA